MRAAVCAGFVMSAGRHAAQFTIVTQPVCEHENLMLGLARSGVAVEWYLETMVYNRAPPDQCFFWGVGGNKGHHWHGGATMPWQGQQGFKPGMLTQGGQGGRPAPLTSRLYRSPTHFLLNLHGI